LAISGLSLFLCTAARAELLLYYNLDEGAGTIAADQSDYGNSGTVGGGWATGESGSAGSISYSDKSSVVTTSKTVALGTDNFTISLWVKGSSYSDWRWLVVDKDSSRNGLYIATQGEHLRIGLGAFFTDVITKGKTTFDSTDWYNVVVVRNGTAFTAYVNGAVDGTGTSSTAVTTNAIKFGSICDGSTGLTGAIDDIAVWNEALTAAQVSSLASGVSPLLVPEPTTAALLVGGLLGLSAYAWRRKWRIADSKI
jgi:hypothetical protein